MSNNIKPMKIFKLFCIFCLLLIFPMRSQILFSEYAEGSSYNKYLEIYNYSSNTVDLSEYGFPSCSNGCDTDGEWDYINLFPDGASVSPGQVYIITHPNATNPSNTAYNEEIAMYSDHTFNYLSNGNDVFALVHLDSGLTLDIIGEMGPDPGTGWGVAGVENATKDHTLVRKSSVVTGNSGDWLNSAGTNNEDSEWIVLDNEIWDNLGFHIYDSTPLEIFGCTDSLYIEYNPNANIDDGSCATLIIEGCIDEIALNYDPNANIDDGSCEYPEVEISGCYWCDVADNYFDFNYQSTVSSMTLAISDVSNLISGDILGVFYADAAGYIKCGGSMLFTGNQIAISAWGDDLSTAGIDGFQDGDEFIFLLFRDDLVYETTVTLNNSAPYTDLYGNNNFGEVIELSLANEFVENCVLPLGASDDCDQFFTLEEVKQDAKILFTTNMLGRVVGKNHYGIVFHIYDDGKVEKNYLLSH